MLVKVSTVLVTLSISYGDSVPGLKHREVKMYSDQAIYLSVLRLVESKLFVLYRVLN